MVKIRTNNILAKNKQGKKGLGLALTYPCAEAIELIGMLGGFDFVNLDGEDVESQIESIFSFGVKYDILQGMQAGVEYILVDDPSTNGRDDYLRLSIGIKF